MLNVTEKVLCVACLPEEKFIHYIYAAEQAGITALSMWMAAYYKARKEGHSDNEIIALLKARNLRIEMLEAVANWPSASFEKIEARARPILELGSKFAISSICAVSYSDAVESPASASKKLAYLSDLAAEYKIKVAVEMLPFGGITNFDLAGEIVLGADRENAGFLIDSWHWYRAGADCNTLRKLPAERIFNIQISDAPLVAENDPLAECMARRLLPGEGVVPIQAMLQTFADMGVSCSVGLEVLSDKLKQQPATEVIRSLGKGLDNVLAELA